MWKNNTDAIASKIKTRMYCLRKLRFFNINPKLLEIFYSSMICSVLSLPSSIREVALKTRQGQTGQNSKKSRGIAGKKQDDLDTLFQRRMTNKMLEIVKDHTHKEYDCRQIKRRGRYRMLKTRTARHSNSFLSKPISLLNDKYKR